MSTPLPELIAAVPALNDSKEPFVYTAEGDTIVGTWDIVKATSLYPLAKEIESIDKDYRITVTFDTDNGTYDFQEHHSSATGSIGVDGGKINGKFEKQLFSGKSSGKSFSWEIGGVRKTDDGLTVAPLTYSFETSRIKEPLFAFLQQHGWSRKKGLLSKLFNR